MSHTIAVILPTLNEADQIESTLDSVGHHDSMEVIVCDGGSQDETVAKAETWGARVLSTAPGRACQMNAGAAATQADTVLFLHADTRLPVGWRAALNRSLAQPDVAGGAFAFASDWPTATMRLYAGMINLRSRWLHRPYGDQGIFIRREIFHALGGYPEWPLLEDVELIRLLRQHGRIVILDPPVITSARRWRSLGLWRIFLRNQRCLIAYRCGVSVETIARWYKR